MTNEQKKCIRELLELSYAEGFSGHPLTTLSNLVKIPTNQLYDPNTETGILWPFDSRSGDSLAGYLHFTQGDRGFYVGIMRECIEDLEHWSEER